MFSPRTLGILYAAASALAVSSASCIPAQAQSALQFSGTWRWASGNAPLPATFEIYPSRRGEGGYCYGTGGNRRCFDVRYTLQGSSYTFTNNGTDWFVMTSPEPGMMNGRYWRNRANSSSPPDATISMRQTGGRRD